MPFIGRDWRSPGEAWVKTETLGWQRMKIIESQLYTSCHQNPTCSWPPMSEFGQHMENHCQRHNNHNERNFNELRNSLSSSGSGVSSSNESSRGSSMSPSPTSSPEKSMHHLYPITISSPYGQYSCCSHHVELGSPTCKTNHSCECNKSDNLNGQQTNAQTMSRSLSRDSLRDNELLKSDRSQTMRYENSEANLSNSSSDNDKESTTILKQVTTSQNRNDYSNFAHQSGGAGGFSAKFNPILLKNGLKLDSAQSPVDDKESDDENKFRSAQINQAAACCCNNGNQVNHYNLCHQKDTHTRTAPHCRISVRTREVAMYNTISEAFYRLDFCNAIHDIRRFNYICKLLHLLITQNLTSLSGCATKVLFTMLEQVAWEVSSNKRNIHVLKNLLNELRQMIQKYYCWGRPIGSSLLWQQHFDTIERISQIVDGIELAPPKNDGSRQATFDNLPVEMIREILLRLNDYRDLMNSAQASPLMRTMLDGQYIWKQLCKYHFTEQQLRMATDGYTGPPIKQKANERGVKYARTSSADGQTSFRNPIVKAGKSSGSGASSTRQQLEQTGSRRGCRQRETTSDTNLVASESYVTNAIKIFDREGSPVVMANGSRPKENGLKSTGAERLGGRDLAPGSSGQNLRKTSAQLQPEQQREHSSDSVRNGHNVDWERVFHQLRKKFDLKEEYADCLLLCRHCRCLFWKSFGHPCVNNHNAQAEDQRFRFDHPCSLENELSNPGQNNCSCDRLSRQSNLENRHELGPTRRQNDNDQAQRRLSVAVLSRNFDNRNLQGRSVDIENAPPDSSLARSSQNASSSQRQAGFNQPLSSINLNAQIRQRNGRLANLRLNGGDNSHNNSNNNLPVRPAAQNEELVPKHVAISPQAFLKFFSL